MQERNLEFNEQPEPENNDSLNTEITQPTPYNPFSGLSEKSLRMLLDVITNDQKRRQELEGYHMDQTAE